MNFSIVMLIFALLFVSHCSHIPPYKPWMGLLAAVIGAKISFISDFCLPTNTGVVFVEFLD